MNFKLFFIFIISQVIEFSVFYYVSFWLAYVLNISVLPLFLTISLLDIIATIVVFKKDISWFIAELFPNHKN
jgi:hypothetical protein